MMALVFLTPIVSVAVISLLIYHWNNVDPSWHPYLATGYGLFAAALLLLAIRHLVRENAAIRPSRVMDEDCPWPAGTSPAAYCTQIAGFLSAHGWRVVSATLGERERVEIIIRKDRWTIVLLVLGPGQTGLSAADTSRLDAMKREAGAARRAVVAADHPTLKNTGAPHGTSLASLRFEDLPRLEEALGLWS